MRYIDADALIKKIYPMGIGDGKYTINAKAVKLAIDNAPTADVVPKSEVEWLEEMVVDKCNRCLKRWSEVTAKEIFEEIEGSIAVHAFTSKSEDYADGMYDAIEWVDSKIAELKKKYIGADE
jgi:hypothetical protein